MKPPFDDLLDFALSGIDASSSIPDRIRALDRAVGALQAMGWLDRRRGIRRVAKRLDVERSVVVRALEHRCAST